MTGAAPSSELADNLRTVVEVAEARKAIDLRVLDLRSVCDFTDFFVICSGTSSRQVQAIAEAIEERLRDDDVRPLHVEGARHGRWILMDYGDFVVHVFDEERRRYYRLEDIWSDAPDVAGELPVEERRAAES